MGGLILQLWEIGWDSRGPDTWIDRDKCHWKFPLEGEQGDPTDILDEIMKDVGLYLWKTAAAHHNGGGLESSGADTTDLRRHLQWMLRRGNYQDYGALLIASCAGTWTRST